MKWVWLFLILGISVANAHSASEPPLRYYDQTGVFQGRSEQHGAIIWYYSQTGKYIGQQRKTDDGTWNQYDATGKYLGNVKGSDSQ